MRWLNDWRRIRGFLSNICVRRDITNVDRVLVYTDALVGANIASSAYAEKLTMTAYPNSSKLNAPTPASSQALVRGALIVFIRDVLYPNMYMLNDREKGLDVP
ncbi:hypothetical protein GN244_ATG08759 [Phytophthora infestans]|uniref:Uncharacterized protein n=1 Tax=Phytophthora infestans TaxID=4787 RepID=A0A833SC90_PHYIN|nr:hypothetical protein GN244_ATG08759 [Phytophthora infestans]KAF4143316.1 hypothetical protein GN958_ATG07493 [Phytophthora infestans]KAF4146314.1 hypothetical protein GN958_ATG04500 [Phytophthora infestans]